MSFFPSVIEKLQLFIAPKWSKSTGINSTESNIKAKEVNGDIAGRDIHKTYITNNKEEPEPPYVFIKGAFGGNGHIMHFQQVKAENVSDEIVFLDRISFLDVATTLNNKLAKPKAITNLQTWDDLTYPTSNENQWLELVFHTRNGNKFVVKQKLIFSSRVADSKYNIALDNNPEIIPK